MKNTQRSRRAREAYETGEWGGMVRRALRCPALPSGRDRLKIALHSASKIKNFIDGQLCNNEENAPKRKKLYLAILSVLADRGLLHKNTEQCQVSQIGRDIQAKGL